MTSHSLHNGPNYLLGLAGNASAPREFFRTHSLSYVEAATLWDALQSDARSYLYNGLRCFLLALKGLDRDEFTWPTVQLYYSAFYAARAFLALSGICIFHVVLGDRRRSQFAVRASAGSIARTAREASTHKFALREFAALSTLAFVRGAEIGAVPALEWLMEEREFSHYRCGRIEDPDKPLRFRFVGRYTCHQLVEQYLNDDDHLYTLDPEHAMIALPLHLLRGLLKDARMSVSELSDEELGFLRRSSKVGGQPVQRLVALLQ